MDKPQKVPSIPIGDEVLDDFITNYLANAYGATGLKQTSPEIVEINPLGVVRYVMRNLSN